jgi:Cu-Zn family superoxide dismutase
MPRRFSILYCCTSLTLILAGCAAREGPPQFRFRDADGDDIGTGTIRAASPSGVEFFLDLHGLPPGDHAIHVHQLPRCEPPAFESAGPHLNPAGKQHGLDNPQGPHDGDMTNVTVASDGRLTTVVVNPRLMMGARPGTLAGIAGASVVIHARPDDMRTDPSGNSGDRIACGVLPAE